MKKKFVILFEGLVAILLIAVFVFVVRLLVVGDESTHLLKAETRFIQYTLSAKQYHSKNFSYEGLCQEIGLPSDVVCADSENEYRMEITLDSLGYYCADSSGFKGKTEVSSELRFSCQ